MGVKFDKLSPKIDCFILDSSSVKLNVPILGWLFYCQGSWWYRIFGDAGSREGLKRMRCQRAHCHSWERQNKNDEIKKQVVEKIKWWDVLDAKTRENKNDQKSKATGHLNARLEIN